MNRERAMTAIVLLALLVVGWALTVRTEWVDQPVARPARGEARDNPVYAAEQILRRLGLQAEHHERLDVLPPPGARLVLMSDEWALVPERATQLQRWVQAGGHLVLLDGDDSSEHSQALRAWLPITAVELLGTRPPWEVRRRAREASGPAADEPAEQEPDAEPPPRDRPAAPAERIPDAYDHGEKDVRREWLQSEPPMLGDVQRIATCGALGWQHRLEPRAGHQANWTLRRGEHVQAMRVPLGQGSVTVLNGESLLLHTRQLMRCEHPLLLAAAVQATPGATVWIYLNEKRQALLPWLWERGWIAVLLGLLAVVAGLWRAAVRFGPLLATPQRLRRSISEQVRGLAVYLHREGPDALLDAQRRALDEVAGRRIAGYERLKLSDRPGAVAAATGLPVDMMEQAMATRLALRKTLPQRLQWLETARRRLLNNPQERSSS